MEIASILHSVLNSLIQSKDALFTQSKNKQENYINRLKKPADDIERSFNQYMCQMKLLNNICLRLVMNIASLPMIIYYLIKHSDLINTKILYDAVFFADGKPQNIIPRSLSSRFANIMKITEKGEYLDKEGREYFFQIWKRHPLSWYFLLKTLIKIRYYLFAINKFSPKVVICCNEYSFTSSSLTKFCEMHGVEHINVMHGEKLFYIRDSFFRFSKCYVWDKHYINLFLKLYAEEKQFIVAIPESLLFNAKTVSEKQVDYTYYLGAETGEILRKVVALMKHLGKNGMRVAIRPHPRYTNKDELLFEAKNIFIEDVDMLPIEDSLLRTENAVSLYSSVLNQAERNGITVVIDDITDPEKYKKLAELDYIMLNKKHRLLSEIVEVHNA